MKKKKEYVPMRFSRIDFILESGIAIGSAQVPGGTDQDDFIPDVEDWGAELGGGNASGDL